MVTENKKDVFIYSKIMAYMLLFYLIGFAFWTIFYTETGNGDNVEHIHSTWMIAYGKTPYLNFFQHHNPLVWYMFAPVFKVVNSVVDMLDVAHAIGVLGGFFILFVVYKISTKFLSSSFTALLSLLILCPPYYYIFCFNYNPDTFMALFFAIGIYFLFLYFDIGKISNLSISFFSFFLSFMCSQKILIILSFLAIISLYVFYKNKTPISDILYSLLMPVLCLILFLAYLYYKDALLIYWQSNYLFNITMQEYYGFNKISVLDYYVLIPATVLCAVGVIFYFKSTSNKYFKILSLLFVVELIFRCFYFSISPYYMLPLMIFVGCLNSVIIDKMLKYKRCMVWLLLMLGCYYSVISYSKYLTYRSKDRSFARYLSRSIKPCDYVISGFLGTQTIANKDPYYYWAMLGHIDVAGQEVGIKPIPNLNELIIKYKPKLIYSGIYWNNYERNRGRNVFVQQIDKKLLKKYYEPTPFSDFYILKQEYQSYDCRYDEVKKDWIYYD